jgi:hypothetical protein
VKSKLKKTKGALKAQRALNSFLLETNYGRLVLVLLPIFLLPAMPVLLPIFLLPDEPVLPMFMLPELPVLVVLVLLEVVEPVLLDVVVDPVLLVVVVLVVFVFVMFVLSPPPQAVQKAAVASKARKAKVLRIEFISCNPEG